MKNSRKQNSGSGINAESQLQPLDRPLLAWLPGESLYSYFVRHHRLWHDTSPSATIQAFFGTINGRSYHQGLRPIDVLVQRTQGRIGEADDILRKHTFMRFYEPFMSERALRGYRTGGKTPDSTLKFPMGLWSGKFVDLHPLKACPDCLAGDLEKYGMTYWHLEHQYPGVWICLEHGKPLQASSRKRKPHERFWWHIPSELEFDIAPACFSNDGTYAKARLFAMAIRCITTLIHSVEFGSGMIRDLRRSVSAYLRTEGLLTEDKKLKISSAKAIGEFSREFLSYIGDLRPIKEFAILADTPEKVRQLISSNLADRRIDNPLEVVALMVWLDSLSESDVSIELQCTLLERLGIGE